MARWLSLPAFAVIGVCLGASVAAAEEQQLELSAYVGSGDNVAQPLAVDPSFAADIYLGSQGNATFERQRPRYTLTARLGGALRYFPESRQFMTMDRSGSLGIDAQIGSTSRLRASQTVQYSPYRQFGPSIFPGQGVGELPLFNPDGAATYGQSFFDLGTLVELSRRFSQRTSLAIDYRSRVSLTDAASELPISQRVGIGVRHAVGRYAAIKLGTAYRFSRTEYHASALPTRAVDFDIGIDYDRPLSFSRGTTLAFSSGTALISRSATAFEPSEVGRQLVAIAAVRLSQTLGRHWEVQLGADRNLQYVDGFPDPFYATRVTSGLSGEIGRSFTLLATAGYSTGSGIGTSVSQNFNGLQAQARLGYKLGQSWQLFGAFHFTDNQLSEESLQSLPPGTVLRPNQASVQVGVNWRIN